MFKIRVETHFKAAHQLPLPDGSKEPLHEHDWQVWADVSADNLDETGIVIDFNVLKNMIKQSTAELEDKSLNEIEYFQANMPSAEIIAEYIFKKLELILPNHVTLSSIRVFEQPEFSAKFTK